MPVTTNMSLDLPDVSTTPGPEWASDLNTALTTVDSHDHTSGKGVPVPTSGININADLPLNSNDLIEARSVNFDNQSSTFSSASDNKSVYVASGELYFRDNSGNNVKITNAGAVNVSGSNGIGGDYGGANPASVFYTDATDLYSFTTDPGVFANLKYRGLELTGKVVLSTTNVAGNPTITTGASDANQVLMVNTSAARTITLPNPATEKRFLIFKDYPGTAQTNPITIARNGSEKIDNKSENLVINESYTGVGLISDGTDWHTILDSRQSPSAAWFSGVNQSIPLSASGQAEVTIGTSNYAHGITLASNRFTFASAGLYQIDVTLVGLGWTQAASPQGGISALELYFYNVTGAANVTTFPAAYLFTSEVTAAKKSPTQSVRILQNITTSDLSNTYSLQWRQASSGIAGESAVEVYIKKIARN